jgi:hypothetical protein
VIGPILVDGHSTFFALSFFWREVGVRTEFKLALLEELLPAAGGNPDEGIDDEGRCEVACDCPLFKDWGAAAGREV